MSDLDIQKPADAKELNVEGATVPFYEYKVGETQIIEFDSSKCGPPEPMVNAMTALNFIKDENTKVIMINHKMPMGLFGKIEQNFDIQKADLPDGNAKMVFSYKKGDSEKADLTQKGCDGH